MMKNKLLCKNTLKGYNIRGTEVINLFTEGWYYSIKECDIYTYIIGNDNYIYDFSKNINYPDIDTLYTYDWFYTPAELRQKQIDSVIYE